MPGARESCVSKVNNLLKVYHLHFVHLYEHYAGLGFTSDPEEIDASYTMDNHEFLQLCEDMKVPSKTCSKKHIQDLCREVQQLSLDDGETHLGFPEFQILLVRVALSRITRDQYDTHATRVKVCDVC